MVGTYLLAGFISAIFCSIILRDFERARCSNS